jgi:gamma-glutamyl hercynylcysteine S-oxide synthase
MKHAALPAVSREVLLAWYREGRKNSAQLFEIPNEASYFDRPIGLRNPIVFYEGHIPAFAINTLIKLALKRSGINGDYEMLFERGIDPESEKSVRSAAAQWPSRAEVRAYGAAADEIIERAFLEDDLEVDGVPQLRGGEAALAILEHEQMHQETLLYMFHNMPYEKKRARPALKASAVAGSTNSSGNEFIPVPRGVTTLGADRETVGFAWDNEFRAHVVEVEKFAIQRHNVTNAEFMDFVERGGYRNQSLWSREGWHWLQTSAVTHPHFWSMRDDRWFWRGMFELIPLPPKWPVYVTHAEADAFARWRGMRLPTEAEYHRAAFGTPAGRERLFPWGDDLPDSSRGNFDFIRWDPLPVGSFPAGASAWGVEDLIGNGWEWTSTPFDGFPGFEPMASYPVYSSDFFDRQHYVMKGASPSTARELVRRSFRNWFRPTYPYVYATFRCVA